MLPDLSQLTLIDAPKRDREGALKDVVIDSFTDEKLLALSNVKWRMLTQNRTFNFTVIGPDKRATFKATTYFEQIEIDLLSNDDNFPCARAVEEDPDYDGAGFKIETLFFGMPYLMNGERNYEVCQTFPNANNKGMGAFVLDIFDNIAYTLRLPLKVDDEANFRTNERPKKAVSSNILLSLSLLRGYGFYQARGFLPDKVSFLLEDDLTNTLNVTNLELQWTHMVATSPVNTLVDKIATFCDDLRNKHSAFIPEVLLTMYLHECQAKIEQARSATRYLISNLAHMEDLRTQGVLPSDVRFQSKQLALKQLTEDAKKRIPFLEKVSMRELADNFESTQLSPEQEELSVAFHSCWWRNFQNTQLDHNDLTKRFYLDKATQLPAYVGISPPETPGGLPKAIVKLLPTNLRVKF